MKSLIQAVAIAAVLAIPAVSFAQSTQSSQPLTRAQVKSELIQIEAAGYNPATANSYDYPANIQRAQARVAAQNGVADSSYGGMATTTSAAGIPVHTSFGGDVQSIYRGH
jgi:hypothetical protein